MKNFKRIIALLLSLILLLLLNLTAFAEGTPQITLSDVSGNPGDSVTVDIKIDNNPGIMTMAFSIKYDSDTFEYTGCQYKVKNGESNTKGYFLTTCSSKDHPDKNYISFLSTETSDKTNNGTIVSLNFKIKDNAKTEKYTVELANLYPEKFGGRLSDCFANSKQQYITPSVSIGSITVGKPCEELGHKYTSWAVVKSADCTNNGQKQRICERCGYEDKQDIPATSHDFETEWTVDKAATPTEDGIMSRHCKKCDAVTDKFIFTYKEVEESEKPNTSTESTESITSASTDNSSNQSASNDSSTDYSPKAPINNTVGEKNSLSAVENIQDFKENVEPYTSINEENKETVESAETSAYSADNSENETSSQEENVTDSKSNSAKSNKALLIILIVCAVIAAGITAVLIIKHKKK